jgi:hypothetical protein
VKQILLDAIGKVSFHRGIVRIECLTASPDGKMQQSGVLMMPGTEAGNTLNTLVKGLQELQTKVAQNAARKA